jgi:hypothetical protein
MSGDIIINKDTVFSLGSGGFDRIIDSVRKKFRSEDAQYTEDIFEWYDQGVLSITLADKGPDHLNVFYDATLNAYGDWVNSSASSTDPWIVSLTPYWERLLNLLRSDPRWRPPQEVK